MNLIIAFYHCWSSSEKGLKNSGLDDDSNPEPCDTGAVLYQFSYQAYWEQVVVWVNYKPVDVEIDDDDSSTGRHRTGIAEVRARIPIQAWTPLVPPAAA